MRRLFAPLALLALALSAGCLTTGNALSEEQLSRDAEYDWEVDATATVDVGEGSYTAVYVVENRSTVTLSIIDGFGDTRPLSISAVQFRYPNGTVVGTEALDVYVENSETVVELPADQGKLAFTAPAGDQYFAMRTPIEGSYEVILPAGMRVGVPVLGRVSPGGYERTLRDDRVHLVWGDLGDESIAVQYYFQRDLYLFGGLVALLTVLALGGLVYFRLQIHRLERNRRAAGLDTERDS